MKKYRKFYWILLLVYFAVLAGSQVGKSELVYFGGDESRHFMNGVLLKDMFVDGGWRHPFEYVRWYYLKYPALSIHQYPPLFYCLEAVLFALFGIQVQVIQILIFTITGISLFVWYRYICQKFQPEVAVLSLLVFISSPLFLNNYSRIMLDTISVSLTLLFFVTLAHWQTSGGRRSLFWGLLLLGFILGIAFKTYFLVFYLILALVDRICMTRFPQKRWIALGLSFFLIFAAFLSFGTISRSTKIPLLYRTLQGINMMNLRRFRWILLSGKFSKLFPFEFIEAFGITAILLVFLGAGFLTKRKLWGKVKVEVLYTANFLFIFSLCITHFEPKRFNLFLLPIVALFCGYALECLLSLWKKKVVYILAMIGLVLFLSWRGLFYEIPYARGYEAAARDMIALNEEQAPILCDAYLDGNFIAFIRKYDPLKQYIVFRGDKLLFVSAIYYRDIKEIYVETEEDIYHILDQHGIQYIAVDGLFLDIEAKALLRKVLQNAEKFRYVKTYPIMTNIRSYEAADLQVYEYLDYKTDYTVPLTIDLPVMNTGYSFTIHELKEPFQER